MQALLSPHATGTFNPKTFTQDKKKIRQRVSDLGYVKVEIQRFSRQGLRGAVPDTADVLIGEVTLRG